MTSTYGFDMDDWNAAKEEMRQAMIIRARLRGMILYSDLCRQVTTITLEPHSHALAAMLGEISGDENAAGRGMLTAIVARKGGDMEPGPGFFELAQELGRDTSDILRCWIAELKKVHSVWTQDGANDGGHKAQ